MVGQLFKGSRGFRSQVLQEVATQSYCLGSPTENSARDCLFDIRVCEIFWRLSVGTTRLWLLYWRRYEQLLQQPLLSSSYCLCHCKDTKVLSKWLYEPLIWKDGSITTDTACSSSLVAINMACRAIWSGECSRPVAGDTNMIPSLFDYQNLAAAGFLGLSGQCKSFDASIDG